MSKIKVELQEHMGSDFSIANAAWTSTYDKEKREAKYDDSLRIASIVRVLAESGHQVPFESVVMRFWMRLPIMTDRQHMTHRVASHNGLSGRYRTLPEDWFGVPQDVVDIVDKINPTHGSRLSAKYDELCAQANEKYHHWLDFLKQGEKDGLITNAEYKRARESIRGVMPVAGMVERTTIFNLVSFANYQRLRNHSHAQPEVREVAQKMLREVVEAKIAPVAVECLMKAGWLLAKPNYEFQIAGDDK